MNFLLPKECSPEGWILYWTRTKKEHEYFAHVGEKHKAIDTAKSRWNELRELYKNNCAS